jgi:hypothetical protein
MTPNSSSAHIAYIQIDHISHQSLSRGGISFKDVVELKLDTTEKYEKQWSFGNIGIGNILGRNQLNPISKAKHTLKI